MIKPPEYLSHRNHSANISYLSGTTLVLYRDHFISSIFLRSRYYCCSYCCSYFSGEGIKAWRGYTIWPGAFSEMGFGLRGCMCFVTSCLATALRIRAPLKKKLLSPAKCLSNFISCPPSISEPNIFLMRPKIHSRKPQRGISEVILTSCENIL